MVFLKTVRTCALIGLVMSVVVVPMEQKEKKEVQDTQSSMSYTPGICMVLGYFVGYDYILPKGNTSTQRRTYAFYALPFAFASLMLGNKYAYGEFLGQPSKKCSARSTHAGSDASRTTASTLDSRNDCGSGGADIAPSYSPAFDSVSRSMRSAGQKYKK